MNGWIRRLSATLLLGMLIVGGFAFGPFSTPYTLKLDFTNIDGVVKGNNVLINGVQAGNVDSLELKDSVGVLTVSVDPKFTPLRANTKAIIRSIGLLGNKYVEILPGPASGAELKSGTELGVDSTTSPTDLDQLNAIFDAPTREKVKTLTLQGEIALGGRAQTLNADLRQLRNLAVAAEPLTGVIDTHQVALDRATIAFDTLTQGLVREDAALRGLVEHGASVFSVLQSNDAALAGLLVHGDHTLTNLDAVLAGNENNFANFMARGPSGLRSTDYSLSAAIPVTGEAKQVIPPLFELLHNMQDSSVGRDGFGNPGDTNSGTQWLLRAMSQTCPAATSAAAC
ncbi:MAG TPA: MlaD family protein [Candidatus Dormibacteraeota bacterium]|jgi:phospholipid/cholesterol/gamma-HCH transport system substrate-binding protein|nr:MlaD family protein [Candidatus Dormibacteraeota bacterium]